MSDLFIQLTLLFSIATVAAVSVRFLRQPFIIAYLAAGIAAGPALFNILSKNHELYDIFAHLGVILLLFVVGLSLNLTHIKQIGKIAIVVGVIQCIVTSSVGFLLLYIFHLPIITAIFISVASTFSSTIIITKLLGDKKDTDAVYGRYTIGLMVVQDVIAIIIMLFMTTKGLQEEPVVGVLTLLLKFLGLFLVLFLLAKYVLSKFLDRIAASGELLLLFTITWCFLVSSFVNFLGFSFEIGAIAAGITLGNSLYRTEIGSRIRPLRDFFLVLFFVLLGSKLTLPGIASALVPGIVLSLFVLIIQPTILYALFRAHKFTRRNSFLIGLTAAQVSEFGFILLFTGIEHGLVSEEAIAVFTITALVTIFLSSYLIMYNEHVYRLFLPLFEIFGKDAEQQLEDRVPTYDVWVIGYHRIGWKICERLKEKKMSFAVIDFNPETIQLLHSRGIPAYFGDVADVEFLSEMPIHKSKLIISTIPDLDDQITLVKHVRSHSNAPYLIANLSDFAYLDTLYHAGASYVMMPHLLGGSWVAELLDHPHITRRTFTKLKREQTKELKQHFN